MKRIPLTQGKFTIVPDEWYEELNQFTWCAWKCGNTFYAVRNSPRVNGKRDSNILMHRVIMDAPDGSLVDHRDGNGLNNDYSNLRLATFIQNIHNQGVRSNNTSGCKGVYWRKDLGKWSAQIGVNNKRISLGYFDVKDDARRAYNRAAEQYHGEFAKTS